MFLSHLPPRAYWGPTDRGSLPGALGHGVHWRHFYSSCCNRVIWTGVLHREPWEVSSVTSSSMVELKRKQWSLNLEFLKENFKSHDLLRVKRSCYGWTPSALTEMSVYNERFLSFVTIKGNLLSYVTVMGCDESRTLIVKRSLIIRTSFLLWILYENRSLFVFSYVYFLKVPWESKFVVY